MSSLPLNAVDSIFLNASARSTQLLSEALAAGFPASPVGSLHEKKACILNPGLNGVTFVNQASA